MGCGTSTFSRDESGGNGGIASLYVNPLHCDSPWRRKGDRPAVDSNPSSKKLLVSAAVDEDGSDSFGHKSASLNVVSPKDEGGFMKEPPVQTMKENIPRTKVAKEERPIGGDRDRDDKDGDRHVVVEEGKGHPDEGSEEEVLFFPRSPSFRYYCLLRDNDSSSSSSSDEQSAHVNEGKSDSFLMRADSNKSREKQEIGDESPAKLSQLSKSQTPSSTKKSRKSAARRLRVVLPKGNPATGMKNLLNVSSCSPRRAAHAAS